jgi:hypothetical protein
MKKIVSSFGIITIGLGALLQAGAAEATPLARTWVSGAGNDSNPCTRASPCATFNGAYLKTPVGGEIDVLDGGDFGGLIINSALTVANDGAGTAAGGAIVVNAGPSDAVVLRGLSLNGLNSSLSGINFARGASLMIDHCTIQGFQSNGGIVFAPNSPAKLWVADTALSNDGASPGASVWIVPVSGAPATAHLERVQILGAIGNGVRVDGTYGGGAIDAELHDVTVDGATGGSGIAAVSATSGGPGVTMIADEVTSSHNAGYGLRAVGGTATIYVSRSTITNNSVGIRASSGGAMVSYSDNRFVGNAGGDGAPTTTIPLK